MVRARPRSPNDPGGNDVSGAALWLAFVVVVASFFVSSIVVQRSSNAVARLAESIIENSAPSIEGMARVRRSVLETELALSHLVERPAERARQAATLDAALADTRRNMRQYLSLAVYPDEQPLRLELQESWLSFQIAVNATRDLATTGAQSDAESSFSKSVEPARRRMLEDATKIIETNAAHGRELASTIRSTRERSVRLSNVLNGVCALMAVLIAVLLHREGLERRALAAANLAAAETRAAELEQFAGRVAHDIRNPLAAANTAAELASRRAADALGSELNRRIIRSLARADTITTDLLAFARSGAKPDPGARTVARTIVDEVIADLSPEAERVGISLSAEALPPVAVACSAGVYLSLLGNLVRNAIKYMRDAPVRRIVVRVIDEGELVRTEVIDTGPGIAADVLPSLFQLYSRGATHGAEGLGLGLATVKRLAEGHGGRVGVRSERGHGSTFWFTLPRAGEEDVELETIDANAADTDSSTRH